MIPAFTPGTYDPVTATFTVINPAQPVDFILRAASTFHAVFIRVRCNATQACTPIATVTEGDLFPGGLATFGVSSGPGSVTVDSINSGTGLQSFTVVGTPTNAVVNIPAFTPGTYNPVTATFTITNPNLPIDFTLRAASTFHAVFIRVQCSGIIVNTFSQNKSR
jgi:phosphopantetheine adenylyltransferase